MTSIRLEGLEKSFPGVKALSGVNLKIEAGELFTLLGPSGCGKTTLLRTIAGFYRQDSGSIHFGDECIDAVPPHRRGTGMVFQSYAIFPHMTVFENVAFGLRDGEAKEIGREEVVRRVVKALEEVNLDPSVVLRKLPAELSGGMRKRVGLARAIVGEPDILLYDEPVTGLDPVNTAAVDQLITAIAARTGVTSLVVTHDVPGALGFCDRIALLEDGVLQFVGSPAEFRSSPNPLVQAFADREAAAALARQGLGAPA